MSFLSRFFGGKEAVNSSQIDGSDFYAFDSLDIEAAKLAHDNWKIRLQAYLDGASTEDLRPEVICFDDRCDLGQWLHGPAKQRLGRFPGFTALLSEHKMFHYAASNVVALHKAGKQSEARKMMDTQYGHFSRAVLERLSDMQYLVEQRKRRQMRA